MTEPIERRRILITGGSGFIGTNLVERYREGAEALLNLDAAPPARAEHRELWRRADLLDRGDLTAAVAEFGPTHVLHLAARTGLDGSGPADYLVNTEGTRNLIAALEASGTTRRVIFASSRLVCEIGYQPRDEFDVRPTTAYGHSKVEMEQIIRDSDRGLEWIIVRPTSIWGPWFGIPYLGFFRAVSRGLYLHPRGRRILKSFGFVGNTVEQVESLLLAPAGAVAGRSLYLGDYPPLEVGDWARTITRLSGGKRVREIPLPLLRAGAWAGDAAGRLGVRNPPLTSFRLDNLTTEMVHDLSPLEEIAGPLPHSLEDGVAQTLSWMKDQGY
jgi:nucleoside-diphosphate-sugar epimerase